MFRQRKLRFRLFKQRILLYKRKKAEELKENEQEQEKENININETPINLDIKLEDIKDKEEWKEITYKKEMEELNKKIEKTKGIKDEKIKEKIYREYMNQKRQLRNIRFSLLNDEEKERRIRGKKLRRKRNRAKNKKRRMLKKKLNQTQNKEDKK